MQRMADGKVDKIAVLSSQDHIVYFNKFRFNPRVTNIAEESLFSIPLCFYFTQKSNLVDEANKQLLRLIDHGFIEKSVSDLIDLKYLKEQKKGGPVELQMSNLLVGFQILIVGWIVGFIVLMVERLSMRVEAMRKIMLLLND